jgi:predicted nucleic acid-binding protein
MALTHLVDTSVLTRVNKPEVRAVLEPLLLHHSVARVGISDLEIGFSAHDDEQWLSLQNALQVFPLVELSEEHISRARSVQRLLAERGLQGRKISDLLVAAAAEQRGLTLLHYDSDVDVIAHVTAQQSQWVTPLGSID